MSALKDRCWQTATRYDMYAAHWRWNFGFSLGPLKKSIHLPDKAVNLKQTKTKFYISVSYKQMYLIQGCKDATWRIVVLLHWLHSTPVLSCTCKMSTLISAMDLYLKSICEYYTVFAGATLSPEISQDWWKHFDWTPWTSLQRRRRHQSRHIPSHLTGRTTLPLNTGTQS